MRIQVHPKSQELSACSQSRLCFTAVRQASAAPSLSPVSPSVRPVESARPAGDVLPSARPTTRPLVRPAVFPAGCLSVRPSGRPLARPYVRPCVSRCAPARPSIRLLARSLARSSVRPSARPSIRSPVRGLSRQCDVPTNWRVHVHMCACACARAAASRPMRARTPACVRARVLGVCFFGSVYISLKLNLASTTPPLRTSSWRPSCHAAFPSASRCPCTSSPPRSAR